MWAHGTVAPPVTKRNPPSLTSMIAGDGSYNTVRLTSLVNFDLRDSLRFKRLLDSGNERNLGPSSSHWESPRY